MSKFLGFLWYMSCDMTKPTKWVCAQRRLRSESLLCTQWVAKGPRFLHADSEDSDQTGRMPRLIWVFTGRTLTLLVLSCPGSNTFWTIQPWNKADSFKVSSLVVEIIGSSSENIALYWVMMSNRCTRLASIVLVMCVYAEIWRKLKWILNIHV